MAWGKESRNKPEEQKENSDLTTAIVYPPRNIMFCVLYFLSVHSSRKWNDLQPPLIKLWRHKVKKEKMLGKHFRMLSKWLHYLRRLTHAYRISIACGPPGNVCQLAPTCTPTSQRLPAFFYWCEWTLWRKARQSARLTHFIVQSRLW